jgi:V-type H+-transporting ATPase subunit a
MTFPFLFAVMFADLFHGSMLFIFAAYLVINANKIRSSKSLLKPMLIARYLLFFMGIFAIYNGLIYNDFTSINIDFFGSCYKIKEHAEKTEVTRINNCVYSFGLDPIWSISENEIAFTNSLKMKISVILGFS